MELKHSAVLAIACGASALAATISDATGADLGLQVPASPPASSWQFDFVPYGWVTWLQGSSTVKGRSVDVDVDPIQLIDDLDRVPFMGYAEARRGPFAFYGDIVYADLGLEGDTVRSRRLASGIGGTLSASVALNIELTIAEAGVVYEVARAPTIHGTTSFDILAGARYWHQKAALDLALTATLDTNDLIVSRGVAIARSGSVDWVDPVVGGRLRHELAPGQELVLRGDIGGFGAGSQFSWNVLAAYGFEICKDGGVTYSGVLGYRLLDVDYEQGSGRTKYEYDVLQHGPISGLSISF